MLVFFEDGEADGGAAAADGAPAASPGAGEAGAGADPPSGQQDGQPAGSDPAPSVSGAGGADAPKADPGKPDAELPTWDGQVASLEKQEWWKDVPEGARATVTGGLKAILTGWQRTYNGKFEEMSGKTKALEADRTKLEADRAELATMEQNWLRMVSNEDDPIGSRDAKIAELTAALEEAKKGASGKVAEDAQAAVSKAKELWDRERVDLTTRADTAEKTLQQFTSEIESAYREHLADWLGKNAPDLVEDGKEPGLQLWLELHAKGHALDDALKMVRTKYPGPATTEAPAKPPDAIANMNMGDRATQRQPGAGGQGIWEQIYRETNEIAQWPSQGR